MITRNDIHTLRLSFKGDRTYLHGTDIIPSLLGLSGPVLNLSVQIYKQTSHTLLARWVNEEELRDLRSSGALCVLMSYQAHNAGPLMIAVTEDLSEGVNSSRPYDEESVAQSWAMSGNVIKQEHPAAGTFFERVVALNKLLLNEIEGKAEWLFVSINLNYIPANSTSLSLELSRKIGQKAYQSTIVSDDEVIGSMVFTRRSPG
jgi:hypothetical protein